MALAVSVVICTFDRPALLAATVASVLNDATQVPYEIVISDNSLAGHADAIVAAHAGGPVPVRSVRLTITPTPLVPFGSLKGVF